MSIVRLRSIFLLTCTLTGVVFSAVELPSFFGDNMVFQREKAVHVWGTAAPATSVSLRLGDISGNSVADDNGHWQVTLPAMQAGGPYTLTIETPQERKTLSDIYIGDVWIFSGQSNMQVSFEYYLTLPDIDDVYTQRFKKTLQTCSADRLVRNYMVATRDEQGQTVRNAAENQWLTGDPEMIQHCNPIAYYFAREVSAKTGVMTAAVRIAWGGQYIERFYKGADVYEYMLKPWGRFPVKGVVWYQGEQNLYKDGDRLGYALKLQLLIRDFRQLWNEPDLPFLIVQLPPSTYSSRPYNDEHSLPLFLEAQRQVLAVPHTAMAVTSDLGMANGLHQPQKYEVAVRLANLALGHVYGLDGAAPAGPQFQRVAREGGKLRVYFETFGSDLVTHDGKAPAFFEVLPAGRNQSFISAKAQIDGWCVLVWHPDVDHPADVRFAFREQDLMQINLTNTAGIPAATFWAGATNQLHPDL